MDQQPDFSRLWTTAEAARAAGVRADVIRAWKSRGHLEQASRNHLGQPLYRPVDVIRAEAATRTRARRVHPAHV